MSLEEAIEADESRQVQKAVCFLMQNEKVPLVYQILQQISYGKDSANIVDLLIGGVIKVAGVVILEAAKAGKKCDIRHIPTIDFGALQSTDANLVIGACAEGDSESLFELLREGGDPNSSLRCGESALHWAARANSTQCIALLLNFGADANIQDWFLDTPLHEAARWMQSEAVVRLLQGGASLGVLNRMGQTPGQILEPHTAAFEAAARFPPFEHSPRFRGGASNVDPLETSVCASLSEITLSGDHFSDTTVTSGESCEKICLP